MRITIAASGRGHCSFHRFRHSIEILLTRRMLRARCCISYATVQLYQRRFYITVESSCAHLYDPFAAAAARQPAPLPLLVSRYARQCASFAPYGSLPVFIRSVDSARRRLCNLDSCCTIILSYRQLNPRLLIRWIEVDIFHRLPLFYSVIPLWLLCLPPRDRDHVEVDVMTIVTGWLSFNIKYQHPRCVTSDFRVRY